MPRESKKLSVLFGDRLFVELERQEKGYYLGSVTINTASFHVEAIRLDKSGEALNPDYQNRIDRWVDTNEGMDFERVVYSNDSEFFINIEAYAR